MEGLGILLVSAIRMLFFNEFASNMKILLIIIIAIGAILPGLSEIVNKKV